MNKQQQILKRKLFETCLKAQQKVAAGAEEAVKEAQYDAIEHDHSLDIYDPYKTQMLGQRDMFAEQLHKALVEIKTLKQLNPSKENKEIAFGSVVITNKQKLFISIGLGKINVDQDEYYAISPKVPIYNAIRGLTKGASFQFNGQTFKIEETY